jgi:hypothetical protein
MCQPEKLVENKNGYVARCNTSKAIQVLFGNVLLSVNYIHFLELIEVIQQCIQRRVNNLPPNEKTIVMSTHSKGLYITMNELELLDFKNMLQTGKLLMDIEQICCE